jgi:hypothetical protein
MRNPLAVFLFTIDHKSATLNKLYAFMHLYSVIRPFPFEHYCVFCRRISYHWWQSKSHYEGKVEAS